MLKGAKLKAAIGKIALITVRGPWWRTVAAHYLRGGPDGTGPPQPLWGGASKIHGARFTPKGSFDCLYLAFDPVTTLAEVGLLVVPTGSGLPSPRHPVTLVPVGGEVSRVLDLTDFKTLSALETEEDEVSGPWLKLRQPPTQLLGMAVYCSRRIGGIKYRSAKNPGGFNLVVFPDRLNPPCKDFVQVIDDQGHLAQRLGSDS